MTQQTDSDRWKRAILDKCDLRALEAVAIGTTALAFAVTIFLVTTGRAGEANPVAAELIGALGWTVAGVLAVAVEAAAFGYLRRVDRRDDIGAWLTLGAGAMLAGIGVADAVYNVHLMTLVDVGLGQFNVGGHGPSVLLVAIASVIAFMRPSVRSVFGEYSMAYSIPERRTWKVLSLSLAIALTMIVPFVAVGPDSIFGSAAAATETEDLTTYSVKNPDGMLSVNSSTVEYTNYEDTTDSWVENSDTVPGEGGSASMEFYWKNTGPHNDPSNAFAGWGNDLGYQNMSEKALINFRHQNTVDSTLSKIYLYNSTTSVLVDEFTSEKEIYPELMMNSSTEELTLNIWNSSQKTNLLSNETIAYNTAANFKHTYAFLSQNTSSGSESEAGYMKDFVVSADTSNSVNGQVITQDGGQPLSNATVETNTSVSTTTDSDGKYSLSLEDGTYEITASKSGYVDSSTTVSVSGSNVTGVDLALSEENPKHAFTLYDQTASGQFSDDPVLIATDVEATGPDSYERTTFNHNDRSFVQLEHGREYDLAVYDDGALYERVGFVANTSDREHKLIPGVNITEGENETTTPSLDERLDVRFDELEGDLEGSKVVMDSPEPVTAFNYTIEDGNETYNRTHEFDEPRSYYEGWLDETVTNGTSDDATLEFAGTYENGTSFNGSTSFSPATGGAIFGPTGSGGSGGSDTSTLVGGGLLLVGGAYAARRTGAAGRVANAASGLVGGRS